jgi:predicted metal-dependent hydrolase
VTEFGDLVVVLPRRAPTSEAERLVTLHARWIERQVARVRQERARLEGRPMLAQGRPLDVDGRALQVIALAGAGSGGGTVELRGDRLMVRPGHDGRDAAMVLEAWLRARARVRIGERVAARAMALGVRPGRITIRDQRSRWASASRNGSLSFSWRLILAPPEVLDAVVVHELAHLRIPRHSREFWTLVIRHAPRTSEARRWLRDHAREVRAALA